jgi:hypothetical protein
VEHTVGPLIEEKIKEDDPIEGILSLKVLDPAMGSGHLLVEATDRLAHALVETLGGRGEEPEEADVRWARREVVERCIYGVDLNPLAVELAKLSLWLHTVAEGKPLNFLDHHLKVGDSLIGAWVDDLASLPVPRKRGPGKEAEAEVRQMNLFEIRLDERLPVMLNRVLEIIRRRSDTLEDIKAKAAADQATEKLKAPFKAVANLWVSPSFGNQVAQADYQEALEHISRPEELLILPRVRQAGEIAEQRSFFHWELEFPEVFYTDSAKRRNPGFDAVVANPPYVFIVSVPQENREYFFEAFATCEYRFDVYGLFAERGLSILARGGYLGYIVPHSILNNSSFEKLRAAVVQQASHIQIIDFTDRVFLQAANEPMLLLVQSRREDRQQGLVVEAARVASTELSTVQGLLRQYSASVVERLPGRPFIVSGADWLGRMLENPDTESLGSIVRATQGLRTGDNSRFLTLTPSGPLHRRVLGGSDLHRYGFDWPGTYVLYDRDALDAPRDEVFWAASQKILVQEVRNVHLPRRIVASFDVDRFIGLNSTNAMILRPRAKVSLYYVMAVISSRLVNEFFRASFVDNHIATQYLESIPMRRILFSTTAGERKRLTDHAQALCVADNRATLLSFADACLAAQPEQVDVIHDLLACLAEQMVDINKEKQAEAKGFLDWLAGYTGLPIEDWRLKTVVEAYWDHPWDEVQRPLRENRRAIEKASGRNVEGREALEDIEREFEKSIAKLNPLLQRIASTDRLIDLIVYRLYGLTEEEVAIVEGRT